MRATLPSNLPSSPSICCPLQMITFLLARRGLRASLSPCHIKAHTPEPLHRAPGGDLGCMVLPASDMRTHSGMGARQHTHKHPLASTRGCLGSHLPKIEIQSMKRLSGCEYAPSHVLTDMNRSHAEVVSCLSSRIFPFQILYYHLLYSHSQKSAAALSPALTRYMMNASTVIYNNSLQSGAIAEEEIEQTGHVICHQMTQFKFKKLPVKNNWLHNWYIRP